MKPHSEQIHNAVRHSFIRERQRLHDLLKTSPKTAHKSINTCSMVCFELLQFTESFARNSWNNTAEAGEMLEYCVETIIEDGLPNYIPKLRPSSEEIRAFWDEISPNLARNLQNAANIAEVPYRRVLGEEEWIGLYERFEEQFNNGKSVFEMKTPSSDKYRYDVDDYAEQRFQDIQDDITNSAETLYLLNYWTHWYSYQLSGAWFAEMFDNSGGYWVDKEFTRFVVVDGNGFIARGF